MAKDQDTIGREGERRDAELFEEENLSDGAWIPLGFAWDSPSEIRSRAKDMEEFADEELKTEKDES